MSSYKLKKPLKWPENWDGQCSKGGVQGEWQGRGELSHGARTVQFFGYIHPASTLLNSPDETTPRNHTQGPNFCTLQPLLAY